MNPVRLIIAGVAIWLAVYVLRRILHYVTPPKAASAESAKNMVRCVQCGLHLPESEAITYHGNHFCCEEHRRRHSDPI